MSMALVKALGDSSRVSEALCASEKKRASERNSMNLQKSHVAAPTLSEINSKLDRSDWTMRKECPACRAAAIKAFAEIRHFKYDRCGNCGFVFANPAPSDRCSKEFYNSDFYENYRTLEEETIAKQPYYSISSYTDPRRLARW